ncbi:alpha/beta hydrolase [Krasilnikovia sp. MM14-A1004]
MFAHGLAGDIAGTRPLGSAVTGRRVFFHQRGHGRSDAPPGPWSFADLADDLEAVADRSGATRAVGVSMGAAAVCRLLARRPDRFARVVLFLPAPLDGVRPTAARDRMRRLRAALDAGDLRAAPDAGDLRAAPDAEDLRAAIESEVPRDLRDTAAGRAYLRQREEQLRRDGLAPQLDTLWQTPAVPDEGALQAFAGRALVIGCDGDELHPAAVAERVADRLGAALHVYDRPDVLWTQRRDLRERISAFLNAPAGTP